MMYAPYVLDLYAARDRQRRRSDLARRVVFDALGVVLLTLLFTVIW